MAKVISILALVLLTAGTSFAQRVDPAKLKINGLVGLNSTYAQVVKALGKPAKDGKATHEECTGGREKTLDYAGLTLHLMDSDSKGGKTFEVKGFFVTSARWTVSGVRVGDTPAAVKAKLGSKYTVNRRTDNGGLVWEYDMGDTVGPGTSTIIFKKGKVVEIGSAFQMC
jgi:hypothetical protein